MNKKKTIRDGDISGKKVVMRVDFNVPLEDGKITDDTRIRAALPTIDFVLKASAPLILISHLGRPTHREEKFSLSPIARHLGQILGKKVIMASDCIGEEVKSVAASLKPGEILLLENTRFHPEEEGKVKNTGLNEEEYERKKQEMKAKQEAFAKQLADLGDIFVNDAFGTAHRAHASTAIITKWMDSSVAGFLLEKELKFLGEIISSPQRPFLAVVGGAKISGKLELLENLLQKVDTLIIGGGMAYTFKKAKGQLIGKSIVENTLLDKASQILEQAKRWGKKLLLPADNIIADRFDAKANTQVATGDFPEEWEGVDIGPETISLFSEEIKQAKTILWNGPMGCFEMAPFAKGTFAICEAIAQGNAVSVVGGGDSVSALNLCGVYEKMTHVSTGGGASLEFLEGKELPGVVALDDA